MKLKIFNLSVMLLLGFSCTYVIGAEQSVTIFDYIQPTVSKLIAVPGDAGLPFHLQSWYFSPIIPISCLYPNALAESRRISGDSDSLATHPTDSSKKAYSTLTVYPEKQTMSYAQSLTALAGALRRTDAQDNIHKLQKYTKSKATSVAESVFTSSEEKTPELATATTNATLLPHKAFSRQNQ